MGEHREALAHDCHRVGIAEKPAHYSSGFFSAAFASSTHGRVDGRMSPGSTEVADASPALLTWLLDQSV